MESPLTHWTPSIAPGGSAFSAGGPFPNWRGDLFVSSLVEGNLRRLRFSIEGELLEEEIVVDNLRRTREVAVGPDGFIYVTAERPGRVLRLVPLAD
jgi:glucose/arabinose dehydrogenase